MEKDRLPDWAYHEDELSKLRTDIRTSKWYRYNNRIEPVDKAIVWLKLYSKNGDTGKVMILCTEDSSDTLAEITLAWKDSGITPLIGGITQPMKCADELYDAMLLVLDVAKCGYATKYPTLVGAEMVYTRTELVSTMLAECI